MNVIAGNATDAYGLFSDDLGARSSDMAGFEELVEKALKDGFIWAEVYCLAECTLKKIVEENAVDWKIMLCSISHELNSLHHYVENLS